MKEKLEILLTELNSVYESSDIKKYCIEKKKKWGCSLIESSLLENKPLIIGFNWGVDKKWIPYQKGIEYQNQTKIEKRDNITEYKGFVKKMMNSFRKYFPKNEFPQFDFERASHSNFCFFRSERECQISEKDIRLCTPIFEKMIAIIKPNIIFCFSGKARKYLLDNNMIKNKTERNIKSATNEKSKNCTVAIGLYNEIPIFCLPHSSYRLTKETRDKAWKFAAENAMFYQTS